MAYPKYNTKNTPTIAQITPTPVCNHSKNVAFGAIPNGTPMVDVNIDVIFPTAVVDGRRFKFVKIV